MTHIVVPKELARNEARVALVPSVIAKLKATVQLEVGAGLLAGYADTDYKGVEVVDNSQLYQQAKIIVKVQAPTVDEITQYPRGALLIAMLAPYKNETLFQALSERGVKAYALEKMPRISRAQAMDVLSSQASIAGYKSVLLAANLFQRFFPMLTTAAGTIRPATVLIIGAGVAGLQAIATAKRLGAMVEAYDIRPEAREQIRSLGAKAIALEIDARSSGGYARELTDEEKRQQQALLVDRVSKADVIITTASVPGKPAPKIIDETMVEHMRRGTVMVDLAAEQGGNCTLTQTEQTITTAGGVTIMGPVNLPSQVARDASEMYARNIVNFLSLILDEQGNIIENNQDEIVQACLVSVV